MGNFPDWSKQDNKHYRGKIDRIRVSMTESWEVDYFVEAYLKRRGADVTKANRDIVHGHMEAYPGPVPIMRDALNNFLDGRIRVN